MYSGVSQEPLLLDKLFQHIDTAISKERKEV